jgi:hypothetical protein
MQVPAAHLKLADTTLPHEDARILWDFYVKYASLVLLKSSGFLLVFLHVFFHLKHRNVGF